MSCVHFHPLISSASTNAMETGCPITCEPTFQSPRDSSHRGRGGNRYRKRYALDLSTNSVELLLLASINQHPNQRLTPGREQNVLLREEQPEASVKTGDETECVRCSRVGGEDRSCGTPVIKRMYSNRCYTYVSIMLAGFSRLNTRAKVHRTV